ncbi:unnamed protein product, partial [Mesorhabditis spiculigera]
MRWEVAIHPPPLDVLVKNTGFDRMWLKYMYGRFKNECPSGRMKEAEFKRIFALIIAPERASDQYLGRMFRAFSNGHEENAMITFSSLIHSLSFSSRDTPEANAEWTIRIVTGSRDKTAFNLAEFSDFAQTVFALQEGRTTVADDRGDKETVEQRAFTIFKELDADGDGLVDTVEMARFFQRLEERQRTEYL